MNSVAIAIVNYNGADVVMTAIGSALRQQYDGPLEVIVVDNGSTDNSLVMLQAIPGIRVIAHNTNGGYAAGANVALAATTADYIAYLNPDADAKPNWIAKMIPFMINGDIAFASSIISAGLGTYFAAGRYFAALGVSMEIYKARAETDWLTGCALVASRAALTELGGFDEGYFLYYEDVDFSLRARERGLRLRMLTEVLVDHPNPGAITNTLGRRKMEIIYHSRGRLIAKHVSPLGRYPALAAAFLLAAFRNKIPVSWLPAITAEMLRGYNEVRWPSVPQ